MTGKGQPKCPGRFGVHEKRVLATTAKRLKFDVEFYSRRLNGNDIKRSNARVASPGGFLNNIFCCDIRRTARATIVYVMLLRANNNFLLGTLGYNIVRCRAKEVKQTMARRLRRRRRRRDNATEIHGGVFGVYARAAEGGGGGGGEGGGGGGPRGTPPPTDGRIN